jgi:hypothetical protein
MTVRKLIVLAIAILLSICTYAPAEDKPSQKEPSEQDKEFALRLAREIPRIDFAGQGLADVIDFMRDVTGMNIFVNWAALENAKVNQDAPVHLKGENIPLRTCLIKILAGVEKSKGSLQFTVEDGVIIISDINDPKNPVATVVTGLPENSDRRLPELNFAGQGLSDVFDFMRDVTGLKLNVDWDALKKVGIEKNSAVKVRIKDTKTSTCISLIMQSVNGGKTSLQCTFKDGVGTITTMAKPEKSEK